MVKYFIEIWMKPPSFGHSLWIQSILQLFVVPTTTKKYNNKLILISLEIKKWKKKPSSAIFWPNTRTHTHTRRHTVFGLDIWITIPNWRKSQFHLFLCENNSEMEIKISHFLITLHCVVWMEWLQFDEHTKTNALCYDPIKLATGVLV